MDGHILAQESLWLVMLYKRQNATSKTVPIHPILRYFIVFMIFSSSELLPSVFVRRASSVNFLHFHLLLENAWLDINQTWQESSLGVGDSKFKSYV